MNKIAKTKIRSAITLALAAYLVPHVAFAQQLEEILVTAQKRSESVQDVPIAIQTLTGTQLEKMGVDTADDILSLFSNVSTNAANEVNSGFTIRGVGTNNFHGNANRSVGVYQDEVSQNTPFSGVLGIYDIERVELLRGPQNSLFGRNTTGGAVNYVSKLPTPGEGTTGYLRINAGSYNQLDVEGALGFDVSEDLAVRISGQNVTRDGLFENQSPGRVGEELGIRDRFSGRIQATWDIGDSTRVTGNYHSADNSGTNIGNRASGLLAAGSTFSATTSTFTLCDPAQIASGVSHDGTTNNCFGPVRGFFPPPVGAQPVSFNPSLNAAGGPLEWDQVYNSTGARQDVSIDGGFIKVEHTFNNGITMDWITSQESTEVQQEDDNSGTASVYFVPTQDAEYDQFSQEIRFASSDDNDFRWIAGFYYFKEDMLLGTNVINAGGAGGNGLIASNILDQEDVDVSFYAHTEYDLSDALTLTFGLRRTQNDKEADSTFRISSIGLGSVSNPQTFASNELVIANTPAGAGVGVNRPCSPPQGIFTCSFPNLTQDLKQTGGKIGLDWRYNDNSMLYASFSRGFKSGGFDTRALVATNPNATPRIAVEPETLDAYEFGYKATLADGAVQLNAAAFYYIWEDLQSFVVVNGVPGFANVPESELSGLDLEMKWQASENLYLSGSIGLLDTEITDVGNLSASLDKGHSLPNTPELSWNLQGIYDIPLASGSYISLQADMRWLDEQTDSFLFNVDPKTGTARNALNPIDSVTLKDSQYYLNFRGTYFTADERYEISVWGENLTEERVCNDIGTLGTINYVTNCSPSEGQRLYGVTAQYHF